MIIAVVCCVAVLAMSLYFVLSSSTGNTGCMEIVPATPGRVDGRTRGANGVGCTQSPALKCSHGRSASSVHDLVFGARLLLA